MTTNQPLEKWEEKFASWKLKAMVSISTYHDGKGEKNICPVCGIDPEGMHDFISSLLAQQRKEIGDWIQKKSLREQGLRVPDIIAHLQGGDK